MVIELVFLLGRKPNSCEDVIDLLKMSAGSKKMENLLFSLIYMTFWIIRKARNAIIFKKERRAIMITVDDISLNIFNWIKSMLNCNSIVWHDWVLSLVLNCFL